MESHVGFCLGVGDALPLSSPSEGCDRWRNDQEHCAAAPALGRQQYPRYFSSNTPLSSLPVHHAPLQHFFPILVTQSSGFTQRRKDERTDFKPLFLARYPLVCVLPLNALSPHPGRSFTHSLVHLFTHTTKLCETSTTSL